MHVPKSRRKNRALCLLNSILLILLLQEVRNAHEEMQRLTSQLYSEVHSDLASDEEEESRL